jgi:hypothetical protein
MSSKKQFANNIDFENALKKINETIRLFEKVVSYRITRCFF